MPKREEEFIRVRELLDFPKEQRPSPHSILSELIRQEQFQVNRLNGSHRAWTQNSTTITTVANQAEYSLTPGDFGKPLFVYRDLGSNILFPVPFTDFQNEINNQKYDFWLAPMQSTIFPFYSGEKCAFFRTSAGARKMRIYPVPETAGYIYNIIYAAGWQDWNTFQITDTPIMPEWSDYRTLAVALFLLPKAEWNGYSRAENTQKRKELAIGLQVHYGLQKDEFDAYIRNPQHEPVSQIGNWYD